MGTATVAHTVRLPTHLLTLWYQVHTSQRGPLDSAPQEPVATSTNAVQKVLFKLTVFMDSSKTILSLVGTLFTVNAAEKKVCFW